MYNLMIGKLYEAGIRDLGVCKETLEMWNELAKGFPTMKYQKMTCNCVWYAQAQMGERQASLLTLSKSSFEVCLPP